MNMADKLFDYAVSEKLSRGRTFKEPSHPYRSSFERDRDRIIHSEAFRRLEGKTQVFTPGLDMAPALRRIAQWQPDDSYRNRLTHSLEVTQIGRTLATRLGLNENLTEAVCLAHDLGHSPFGHTGEKILDGLMTEFGGFEHNKQTLRIVDLLEHPYPDFPGLNLMYETRLGLAKHRTVYDKPQGSSFCELNCSVEGQVADLADRIAYNCHDLEDGMRAGLISAERLENVQIFTETQNQINADSIKDPSVSRIRTAKTIIDKLVSDGIETSKKTLEAANIKTLDDVYSRSENLIVLSPENDAKLSELEKFLLQNIYQHESVVRTTQEIESWLQQLFEKLCQRPQLMPAYYQALMAKEGKHRTVCDYIAGMTDRFCLKMLEKI